jgi:uncharacterized protein (DUF1015 family)
VVKPQLVRPGLRQGTSEFLEASAGQFHSLVDRGSLTAHTPACWLYRQELQDGTCFEGWILGISALDYEEGNIRKHENTIRDKESRLARHIRLLESVAEPVLLAGSLPEELHALSGSTRKGPATLDFQDSIGRRHMLWIKDSDPEVELIRRAFGGVESLYIADGHHRSAATCLHIREAGLDPEQNGIMALVMDKDNLSIKSFHRAIHAEATPGKLQEICKQQNWEMIPAAQVPDHQESGTLMAWSQEGLFALRPRAGLHSAGFAERLDVARLEAELFPGLFGIENTREDSRISFLRGDVPHGRLKLLLQEGKADWIFMVAASTMDDIVRVADAGEVMPPKSTFVEPKLMTGMLIMRLKI